MPHLLRTAQSTPRRTLALASAFLVAGVATPPAGHAQAVAQERTLLERVATPSIAKAKSDPARPAATDLGIPGSVEGARALLNHIAVPSPASTDPGLAGSADGEKALLSRTQTRERHELDRGPAAGVAPTAPPVDGERALLGR